MLLLFSYIPMFGIVIAFQNFMPTRGFFGSPFIGLERFRYLFKLPNFINVIRNTLIIAVFKIFFTQLIALLMALVINELRASWFRKTAQTVALFPYFLSWVVLGGICLDLFAINGAVNWFFQQIGFKEGIFFLGSPSLYRVFVVVTDVWKNYGYTMVILLAALAAVDPTLYESAVMDGANRFQQVIHITIPSILPTIILLLVLALGGILNAGFDQIFLTYNPLVYSTGDIIDTMVYRTGFEQGQYSLATAAGIFKSVVGFILILSSNELAKRLVGYKVI
jgi:putative aldouronate transport system permease protein